MTAAGLRREIGQLADLCERHCGYAERSRLDGKPRAALAHSMCAADYAQQAQRLADVLRERLVARAVRA